MVTSNLRSATVAFTTELDTLIPYLLLINFIVVRLVRIHMGRGRVLRLQSTNQSTLMKRDSTEIADITISNSSQSVTSSNNLLAYRPRFDDFHNSGLGAIFINIEGVFPCVAPLTDYSPICSIFSDEEDGFRNGMILLSSSDMGNNLEVFSTTDNIRTYGIAVQDCPELNRTCFPNSVSIQVACYLPRGACS